MRHHGLLFWAILFTSLVFSSKLGFGAGSCDHLGVTAARCTRSSTLARLLWSPTYPMGSVGSQQLHLGSDQWQPTVRLRFELPSAGPKTT